MSPSVVAYYDAKHRFWLRCMDVLARLGAWRVPQTSWRWRAYSWCIGAASDAYFASYPPEEPTSEPDEETPF